MIKLTIIFILIGYLTGCATPYKPKDARGGYYDYPELSENQYVVGFIGNKHTRPTKVMEYTKRRARELCAEKGLNSYEVLKEKNKVKPNSSKNQIKIECKYR